jgi:glycosyltransferase involved in cell wall biosynthesis
MNDHKIVAMIGVKNGEPWISKTLKSASDLCKEIVVFDDGSTDNTLKICKSFNNVVDIKINDTNMPFDEARNSNILVKMASKRNPDYILALDHDEVLQPNAKKILFKELLKYPDATVFEFQLFNIWDKPNMYRVDGSFVNWWRKKLLKMENQPKNLFIRNTGHPQNLHCKHIPENARGWHSPVRSNVKIFHYGYYDKAAREQKYQYYNEIDPNTSTVLDGNKQLELSWIRPGNHGLEFRYLPKGMFDESIP